jgi:hypothetical protein
MYRKHDCFARERATAYSKIERAVAHKHSRQQNQKDGKKIIFYTCSANLLVLI